MRPVVRRAAAALLMLGVAGAPLPAGARTIAIAADEGDSSGWASQDSGDAARDIADARAQEVRAEPRPVVVDPHPLADLPSHPKVAAAGPRSLSPA
ncbi:hypothetical protein LWE61_06135 [Sphingobium sufflavum]|nr:hypothetical protein [Sphingobium sufflavum]